MMKRLLSTYGFSMVLLSLVLVALSSVASFTLYLNPVSPASAATIEKAAEPLRQLYFLKSKDTIRKMYSFGLSDAYYLERLDALKRRFRNNGYSVTYIDENQLANLPDRSSLFVFDAMDMSDEALATIKSFVRQGGSLVFNYHFAYHNNDRYRGDQAIRDITGLVPARTASHIRTKGELYLSANVLSPLTAAIHPRGSKIGIELYDSLPLFKSASLRPDAIVTSWNVSTTLKLTGQQGEPRSVKAEESGALWHGRFGKGNWIYTTLPSYSLYSSAESQGLLEQLLIGMAEHSSSVLQVQSFPYLDIDKVVFVSEDTEFKFSSFAAFAELSNRYKVPVTAFLVAGLADKNRELVSSATQVPYLEFGSHSYTHKKIVGTEEENYRRETDGSKKLVEALTGKPVRGFRPPREELDAVLTKSLIDSGYSYVLEKRKDYLYPTIESGQSPLFTIPRTGTDDYLYMVNLKWSPDKILQNMIAETQLLTSVNGIYSLSIHTHLMAYKRNIDIIEKYFRFLSENPGLTALSGGEIIDRVTAVRNVVYRIDSEQNRYRIYISNQNPGAIERLKFRAYWPPGKRLEMVHAVQQSALEYVHNERQGYTDITLNALKPASKIEVIAEYSE